MPHTSHFSALRLLLGAVLICLHCTSCSPHRTQQSHHHGIATMDIVLDTAGERMFYHGTAMISRGFHSREPFPLRIQLSSWGNPPANETSRKAAVILSDQFDERGRFLPRTRGEGEIKLAGGSLQLLGLIRDKGKELDGAWFLDGVEGGGFRITPKGYLFP